MNHTVDKSLNSCLGVTQESKRYDFKLYGPNAHSASIVIYHTKNSRCEEIKMEKNDGGFWIAQVEDTNPGDFYKYILEIDAKRASPVNDHSFLRNLTNSAASELENLSEAAFSFSTALPPPNIANDQRTVSPSRQKESPLLGEANIAEVEGRLFTEKNDPRGNWVLPANECPPEFLQFGSLKNLPFYNVIYDHEGYSWNDSNWNGIENTRTTIFYELDISTFTKQDEGKTKCGTFRSAKSKLQYLKDLGINAVLLTSLYVSDEFREEAPQFDADPYSLSALNPYILESRNPDEVKEFVDAAHQAGIAVFLDAILDHISNSSYLNYFDSLSTNLYIHSQHDIRRNKIGFEKAKSQELLLDIHYFQLVNYHFDGVKIDATNNVRFKDGKKLANTDGFVFLQHLTQSLKHAHPQKIVIADDQHDHSDVLLNVAGFDYQFDEPFFKSLYRCATNVVEHSVGLETLKQVIQHRYSGATSVSAGRIIYIENHKLVASDRFQRIPSAISSKISWLLPMKSVSSETDVQKRTSLLATILFSVPGVPLIFQGQEIYTTTALPWPLGSDVMWENMENETCRKVLGLFSSLIDLRKNRHNYSRGLTGEGVRVFHESSFNKIIAYHRWDKGGHGDDVIVVINWSGSSHPLQLGVPRHGTWHVRFQSDAGLSEAATEKDLFALRHDTSPEFADGMYWSISLNLRPNSALILSQEPLETEK